MLLMLTAVQGQSKNERTVNNGQPFWIHSITNSQAKSLPNWASQPNVQQSTTQGTMQAKSFPNWASQPNAQHNTAQRAPRRVNAPKADSLVFTPITLPYSATNLPFTSESTWYDGSTYYVVGYKFTITERLYVYVNAQFTYCSELYPLFYADAELTNIIGEGSLVLDSGTYYLTLDDDGAGLTCNS